MKSAHYLHGAQLVDVRIDRTEANGDRAAYDTLNLIVVDGHGSSSTVAIFFDGDAAFVGIDIGAAPRL